MPLDEMVQVFLFALVTLRHVGPRLRLQSIHPVLLPSLRQRLPCSECTRYCRQTASFQGGGSIVTCRIKVRRYAKRTATGGFSVVMRIGKPMNDTKQIFPVRHEA